LSGNPELSTESRVPILPNIEVNSNRLTSPNSNPLTLLTGDSFAYNIDNSANPNPVTIAILAAWYDDLANSSANKNNDNGYIFRRSNPIELNKYLPIKVDYILDDDLLNISYFDKTATPPAVQISAADNQFSIRAFRRFVLFNKIRFNKLIITTDAISEIESMIRFWIANPFKTLEGAKLVVSDATSKNMYTDNKAELVADTELY
jgi:hypothetical protein